MQTGREEEVGPRTQVALGTTHRAILLRIVNSGVRASTLREAIAGSMTQAVEAMDDISESTVLPLTGFNIMVGL